MAQTLEKIFLQKVASMPQEEQELVVTIPKNSHKKGAKLAGRKSGSFANGRPKGGKDDHTNLFFSFSTPGQYHQCPPGACYLLCISHSLVYSTSRDTYHCPQHSPLIGHLFSPSQVLALRRTPAPCCLCSSPSPAPCQGIDPWISFGQSGGKA